MISLNFEGHCLIETAKSEKSINLKRSQALIQKSIIATRSDDIKAARKNVFDAYKLISDCCSSTFIAVKGLKPKVLNEQSDAQKHNRLKEIEYKLYYIFSENTLWLESENHLTGSNVVSYIVFQLYRIHKEISNVEV